MKNLCLAVITALFLFASCAKKSEGTHTHEDGTEHADHDATNDQEEFSASDSTHHEHDSTEHHHDSTTHKHSH